MVDKNIAFIGAGNMCRAIVNGLLTGGVCDSEHVKVLDKDTAKYADFKKIGVYSAESIDDAASFADFLFLCVKPQNFEEVVAELSHIELSGKTIVTIAAGVSTSYITANLGHDAAVVRVMPNTPMLIGMGACAICKNAFVGEEEFDTVCKMFRVLGTVRTMDESKLNAVIAVNGSSPAYIYLMIKSMIDWATEQGFDAESAKQLVCATVEGSAEMVLQSDKSVDELIRAVSSPGGTTLAALAEFEKAGFSGIVGAAMTACTKRADELAR